tara:strand:+ start:378 stop:1028 length:651 start_codon:yes stop_codon:yes gene_type:complete
MGKSGEWHMKEEMKRNGDDGYDEYLADIKIAEAEAEYEKLQAMRERAEAHVMNWYNQIVQEEMDSISPDAKIEEVDLTVQSDTRFHNAIWHASTEILPALEVQVVIDGKNNCYVTTGSSGYVGGEWESGLNLPVGMTLPIRCWIHTHPFGSAYFSGTDIRTVSIWEKNMLTAYVLGSGDDKGHYGYWENTNPKQLEINRMGTVERIQTWGDKNEEE